MFLNLEGRLNRCVFDKIAPLLGIIFSPNTNAQNTYYRNVHKVPIVRAGTLEYRSVHELIAVKFGGINETEPHAEYATQLIVDASPKNIYNTYEAMRETVLALGFHFPIATISGDYINQIHGQGQIAYSPSIFERIDRQFDKVEAMEKAHLKELYRQGDPLRELLLLHL
jgi:hypothetical protein